MARAAEKLAELAMGGQKGSRAATSRHWGTVSSVSGGLVSVLLDGASSPTPCESRDVKCLLGDRVEVEVRDHKALVRANTTHPVTDDALAEQAAVQASAAQGVASQALAESQLAQTASAAAQQVAAAAQQGATEAAGLAAAASSAASSAMTVALDGATLALTSTAGQLFKNGSESTVLQVAVFPNGGGRLDTIEQVRARFGAGAYIEWRWMHESTGTWGTLVSSDAHLSQGGMWCTVTPSDVATKTTFEASLVVPE